MNLRVFYLTRRGLSDGYRQSISINFDPSAFNGFLAFSWKQKNRRCFAGMQNTGDCKCKCVQVRWAIKLPSQRLRDVP